MAEGQSCNIRYVTRARAMWLRQNDETIRKNGTASRSCTLRAPSSSLLSEANCTRALHYASTTRQSRIYDFWVSRLFEKLTFNYSLSGRVGQSEPLKNATDVDRHTQKKDLLKLNSFCVSVDVYWGEMNVQLLYHHMNWIKKNSFKLNIYWIIVFEWTFIRANQIICWTPKQGACHPATRIKMSWRVSFLGVSHAHTSTRFFLLTGIGYILIATFILMVFPLIEAAYLEHK